MPPNLSIWQQTEPKTSKPFKLIELIDTSDGLRSRICDGQWSTLEEAQAEIKNRLNQFYKGLI